MTIAVAPREQIDELSREDRSSMSARLASIAHGAGQPHERRAARDELIRINLRVARALAGRYRGRGVALEDLEQVACEALVKAVDRFDPSRHHDLLSYAVPTIRGELQHHFRDSAWVIRPPRRLQEMQGRISTAIEDLAADLGRNPTRAEVCEALHIDGVEHDEAARARACFHPTSLDQPAAGADGALTVGDGVMDQSEPFADVEARALLATLTRSLSERDRRILQLRFVHERTQSEIAADIGVSQMQVSRLLSGILRRLRAGAEAGPTAA